MRATAAGLFLALGLLHCKGAPLTGAPRDAGVTAQDVSTAEAGRSACRANTDCSEREYCAFSPGLCGRGKKSGTCEPVPDLCAEVVSPVCGCDGKTYPSECAAHQAGIDLAVMGGCKEEIPDWVACGARYCDARTSYCEIFLSDVFDLPTDYFCRQLPPSCLATDAAARTCDCFPPNTRCRAFCGPLFSAPHATSTFHLTCQGQRPPDR